MQATAEAQVPYEVAGAVAAVTMNRPRVGNARHPAMSCALDDAFTRAAADDAVRVIVPRGAGRHFSAGHDIGTAERDEGGPLERRTPRWDAEGRPGAEAQFVREQEQYLGLCRRWHEIPKPTIVMVQGGCIAGGLMRAWICDLIVAAEDAFFQDPVLRMSVPGVEYFAHAQELNVRRLREFRHLGERTSAERAYRMGMVDRVVPADLLEAETHAIARRPVQQPKLAPALAKQVFNRMEDLQGLRASIDLAFGHHHLAHAHNPRVHGGGIGGQDPRTMAAANRDEGC